MKDYVIISDSTCELDKDERQRYGIEYLNMHFTLDGVEYPADLDWKMISAKDFYTAMRNGAKYKSAQVNEAQYLEGFLKILESGKDILSISCSSALSASVNFSRTAKEKLLKKFPDAKIYCIDALSSGYAMGLLCLKAGEMKRKGASIDAVAEWVEANKKRSNQEGAVDKLIYLKQAGRVSATAAFFGGLLNVKPIVVCDSLGRNVAVEKVKGRHASLVRVAEKIADEIDVKECKEVRVNHADCLEDAETLVALIKEKLGDKVTYRIGNLGPIVGGSSGPGTVVGYAFGKNMRAQNDR